MAGRTLVTKLSPFLIATRSPSLLRLRPLIAAGDGVLLRSVVASVSGGALRSFSSRPTTSSLNDPSPNWSNRPPKETILLEGCDFEHWLIVMEPPEPNATRDEIIDSYIKTLAEVVGSEQEARMKIYSVSTKHYFAFGALVSEELSYKIKTLPKVRWVLPDSYLDVRNKDYGGEPFINGEAVPYDPKYHEEWVRNNARANERSRRNDRPRNFDRSRNFERRRETMQNRDAPPMQNQDFRSNPAASPPNAPPPPMGNHDFNRMPNSNAPPSQPPSNVGYQNQVPPMQNQDFQSTPAASPPNAPPPPMGNHNFNRMPNSNALPSPTLPNVGYQNQAPPKQNQDFQSNPAASPPNAPPPPMGNRDFNRMSNSNAPPLQPPPNVGYQNQVPNTNYQGSPQAYQGQGGGAPAYQGQGYQGGNPGYQGGAPGYQGGNPGYQGGNPEYRGGPPPPQGGNNYQAGNGTGYQVYQGGSNPPPSYQGGSYQGGNPTNNYQGGNPAYQGRDVPGRDYQ